MLSSNEMEELQNNVDTTTADTLMIDKLQYLTMNESIGSLWVLVVKCKYIYNMYSFINCRDGIMRVSLPQQLTRS